MAGVDLGVGIFLSIYVHVASVGWPYNMLVWQGRVSIGAGRVSVGVPKDGSTTSEDAFLLVAISVSGACTSWTQGTSVGQTVSVSMCVSKPGRSCTQGTSV